MNDLVTIEEKTVLAAFTSGDGLDSVITETRNLVEDFEHDLSTVEGRKLTASLAMKVRKLKTKLDGMGKDLTAEWAKKKKAVDTNRKSMRDELDELATLARKPLDDFEAKEEEEYQEFQRQQEAEKLAIEKEGDHEFALLLEAEHNRAAEADRLRAEELQRQADDDRARVIKAKLEHEAKAKQRETEAKQKEAERREAIANTRAEAAEILRVAIEARAEEAAKKARLDAEAAKEQAKEQSKRDAETAIELAKIAADRAVQAEIDMREAREQKEREELAAREADVEHRRSINTNALNCLVENGLSTAAAETALRAIIKGNIPHVSISY